jgi:prepilin-type N-terminal cleavage/methylation domain-containing protein
MSALLGASIVNRKSQIVNRSGFTLIELLTVIAIMALLAALIMPVIHGLAKTKYRSVATAELGQIENALEDYKAKYGVYPPSNANPGGILLPQLYYELKGVTNNGKLYITLDGGGQINVTPDVQNAFGVGGFVNCWKGSGDDATPAKNFLLSWKANRFATVLANGIQISNLVTSVGGPDATYAPLGPAYPNINPFRYIYPGSNNPSSYDLYVEIRISGQTNLICNWHSGFLLNTALP